MLFVNYFYKKRGQRKITPFKIITLKVKMSYFIKAIFLVIELAPSVKV